MRNYLSTLTPLRGIAAVLVMLFHSHIFLYPVASPATGSLLTKGWIWVDFFFVLSGFILCHVYGDAFQDGIRWPVYRSYLRARIARVYPLHFVTLLWVLAAGTLVLASPIAHPEWNRFFHFIFDIHTVPASLLFLQAMHLFPTAPMNTVSWSLSTEWWVYLLFPALAPGVLKRGRGWVWGVVAAALYGLVKYYLVPEFGMHLWRRQPATLNTINDFAFVRCLAGFLLGMVVYRWFRAGVGRRLLAKDATFAVAGVLLLASLYADVNELITVVFFPLLILTAAYNESTVSRWLGGRAAQRLGDWSFSIYMVHMPLFFTYRGIAPLIGLPAPQGFFTEGPIDYPAGWLWFAGFLAVTLVTAALFYRYLEVPARNYLNRRRVAGLSPLRG